MIDKTKRPIDQLRDAALSLQVGGDDNSHIVDFYKIGEKRMLLIKGKGIYEITLPDQIDPGRTNASLQPTQQRVLDVGAEDELVGRILLTAKTLFQSPMLGFQFEYERALEISYALLRDLVATRDAQQSLSQELGSEALKLQARKQDAKSVLLPSIPNIYSRCDTFSLKTNHVAKSIRALAELFYGQEITNKWVDSLVSVAATRHDAGSPLNRFLASASPILLFIINMRNAIEHPSADARITVTDFSMNEKGEIVAPTIEVAHKATPQPRIDAEEFMLRTVESLVEVSEGMMACLCAVNVQPVAKMQVTLGAISEGNRRNGVRFGYFAEMGGRHIPFA